MLGIPFQKDLRAERCTPSECILSDAARHPFWKGHRRETGAQTKRMLSDAGQSFRKGHRPEPSGTIKSPSFLVWRWLPTLTDPISCVEEEDIPALSQLVVKRRELFTSTAMKLPFTSRNFQTRTRLRKIKPKVSWSASPAE